MACRFTVFIDYDHNQDFNNFNFFCKFDVNFFSSVGLLSQKKSTIYHQVKSVRTGTDA